MPGPLNQPELLIDSSLLKIRKRIFKIIDQKLYQMSQNSSPIPNQYTKFIINQSKVQQWVEFFGNDIICLKEQQYNQNVYQIKKQQTNIHKIQLCKPFFPKNKLQKTIFNLNENLLHVFELQQNQKLKKIDDKCEMYMNDFIKQSPFKQSIFELPQGLVKKYSSITFLQREKRIILVGGCKKSNLNIKSSRITQFNLNTQTQNLIAKLPYGLSSHFVLYHPIQQQIYIIGGNKNYSVVTRGCYKLSLVDYSIKQISCLNYPVASSNCILWKQNWIYKFGGVGQAFGIWNTSPYVERYSITDNEWQVINPVISSSLNQSISFSNLFLANSSSYLCQDEQSIFVFGGFSINGQWKRYGFLLECSDKPQTEDNDDSHVIKEFGTISTDCQSFLQNQFVFHQNSQHQLMMYGMKDNQSQENKIIVRRSQQMRENRSYPIIIHRFQKDYIK